MTSTVTRGITDALPPTPGLALVDPTGGIIAVFLILLLLGRVLVQVAAVDRSSRVVRTIDIAAIPLMIAFAMILYARFQEILPLG